MESKENFPKTLQQAIVYFSNPDNCREFLMTLRWPVASLGGGLALFVVVMLMGIGYGLYQSPEPLVPALQSYWLKIHVSSMMASSGILAEASGDFRVRPGLPERNLL